MIFRALTFAGFLGFQHLPQNPANVNACSGKTCLIPKMDDSVFSGEMVAACLCGQFFKVVTTDSVIASHLFEIS